MNSNNIKSSANCNRLWVPNLELKENVSFLRIASYNLLADSLISASTDIPESDLSYYQFLSWDLRKQQFIQEINHFNCDIICIQEIERDKKLIEDLNKLGYELIFTPRPNNHSEGCGILTKSSRLKLINCYSLNFNINQNDNNKTLDNVGMKSNISTIFDRDNISCIGVYHDLKTKKYMIISSSHLLFNKNRGEIKLGQIYMNLKAIELLKKDLIESCKISNDEIITIIGGDLNSVPNSAIYKLITEGEINCDFILCDLMSGQNIDLENNHNLNNSLNYKKSLINFRNGKYEETNTNYSKLREFKSKDSFLGKNELILKNSEWFNEIMQIRPLLKNDGINIEWINKEDEKYRWKDNNMILKTNFKYESSMARLMNLVYNFYLSNDKNSDLFKNFTVNEDDKNYFEKLSCFCMKKGSNPNSTKSFFLNSNLEPIFTKATKGVFETVDYIFYEGKNVEVLRVLDFPDFDNFFYEVKQLPNDFYPSDHLPVIADFIIN